MELMDEIYDDENVELSNMREARKEIKAKDFSRLLNKKVLSNFEMDELFM